MASRKLSAIGWAGMAAICLPAAAGAAQHGALVAYVDPGAGSFLLQALVAALAGIIVTVNVYWTKIKRLLGFGSSSGEAEDSASPDIGDE